MQSIKTSAAAAALLFASLGAAHAGFSLTVISPSSWGATDDVLGVAGHAIENFEDATLIPGLQIGWTAPSGTILPSGTLPATFDPLTGDPYGSAFSSHPCGSTACTSVWDGTKVLVSGKGNVSYPYNVNADANWGNVDLLFATPAKSVGFSVQQNESAVTVRINGAAATLVIPAAPSGGRLGYVRIDATGADSISALTLDNFNSDAFAIDHLAVAAVPEPQTYALMLAGLGIVGCLGRRMCR